MIHGGSGWNSHNPMMPELLPERFEAGTLPTPAIAALRAGLDFLKTHGIETVEEAEKALTRPNSAAPQKKKNKALLYEQKPISEQDFNNLIVDLNEEL